MYNSIDDVVTAVTAKIRTNDLQDALIIIRTFVESFMLNRHCIANVFGSPILDKLCQQIGEKSVEINQLSSPITNNLQNNKIVYLASALYLMGGHTAVIRDLIAYQPHKQHLILVTEMLPSSDHQKILASFAGLPVTIQWSTEKKYVNKMIWLQKQLYSSQANKVFIFNHHQDAAIIAAVQPNLPFKFFFYHHGDHDLCLGLYLEHVTHIDPHNIGFFNCRDNLGVKNNLYWPLAATDLGVRSEDVPFISSGKLITCSSGGFDKFSIPYLYSYAKFVPEILKQTNGIHIHIGNLSKQYIAEIHHGLKEHGIELSRFKLIPRVESLWKTLLTEQVDLYIASFPYGGGKAAIEVMGSGTPMICHINYRAPLFGGNFLAYPEALRWAKPAELFDYLANITPGFLQEQSIFARQHYEKYHACEILKEGLQSDSFDVNISTPLPLENYKRDDLQTFLEIHNEIHKVSFRKVLSSIQVVRVFYRLGKSCYNDVKGVIQMAFHWVARFSNVFKRSPLKKTST